jgi:hypothetical protein
MKSAYVYAIVVDGVIRYIGKGHGNRTQFHFKMMRRIARRRAVGETVTTTHFYNRLTKAWLNGASIEVIKIAEGLTDAQAFEREIAEIAERPGLWNKAPGGQGYSSESWANPEFRKAMQARKQNSAIRSHVAQSMWDTRKDELIKRIWNDERRMTVYRAKVAKQLEIEHRKLAFVNGVWERKIERERNRKGYRANSGSFTSEKARIVQLSDWQHNRERRLASINRDPKTGRLISKKAQVES